MVASKFALVAFSIESFSHRLGRVAPWYGKVSASYPGLRDLLGTSSFAAGRTVANLCNLG